jgi:hypothetical protein
MLLHYLLDDVPGLVAVISLILDHHSFLNDAISGANAM